MIITLAPSLTLRVRWTAYITQLSIRYISPLPCGRGWEFGNF